MVERLVKLKDIEELTSFFYRDISVEKDLLLKKSDQDEVVSQLEITSQVLTDLPEFNLENLENSLRSLQAEHDWKKSQYFMLLRVAVTGKTATPPLFETMEVLGKARVLARLEQAKTTLTK